MKGLNAFLFNTILGKIIFAIIVAIVSTLVISLIEDIEIVTIWKLFFEFQIPIWLIVIFIIVLFMSNKAVRYFKEKEFEYNEEERDLDKVLFEKIRTTLLPKTGTIDFLRTNNFAGFGFKLECLDDLKKFNYETNHPDFEFFNPELEKIKLELSEHIIHFIHLIGLKTFPTVPGTNSVPAELEINNPDEFRTVVNEIHKTSEKICNCYDNLIRIGRKTLKI